MGVNSLPKTVTRQRRDCDLNPGPSAPESSTLTTRVSVRQSRRPAGLLLSALQAGYRSIVAGAGAEKLNADSVVSTADEGGSAQTF